MAHRQTVNVPCRIERSQSWGSSSSTSTPIGVYEDLKSKFGLDSWTMGDGWTGSDNAPQVRLPLASFNHIAREVLSLEKSKLFYVDILGFEVGPRPPFDSDGYWLYGYGLSLHLVQTTQPESRRLIKRDRIKYFTTCLPRVDHIAFITTDISIIRKTLDDRKVYYKEDKPGNTGIEQIFFFDPDGNVIEVSNCARMEQQCGVLGATTVAAVASVAAASRSPSQSNCAFTDTRSPHSVLSPSQIYINGPDVIVSSTRISELDGGEILPNHVQAALDASIQAASSYSTIMRIAQQQESNMMCSDDCAFGEEGLYVFDESFDFEEKEGLGFVVAGDEAGLIDALTNAHISTQNSEDVIQPSMS